jgi:hypothetical protein
MAEGRGGDTMELVSRKRRERAQLGGGKARESATRRSDFVR